jgi:hypothetical protein
LLSTVDTDALAMTTSLATIILIPMLMTESDLLKKNILLNTYLIPLLVASDVLM